MLFPFFSCHCHSPPPSPPPSPAPTSTCIIDVSLDGCPEFDIELDNDCNGRPWVMEFKYNGGGCAQSNNLQPRQKFTCTDSAGGPPNSNAVSYITATPRGGSDNYFSGSVAIGDKFVLNEDRAFDKLAADMTITIFDREGGTPLQTTDLHLSCSQPLFLFDRFGASQVTEWVETNGRVVSDKQLDVKTGNITVALEPSADQKPVRLLQMSVLTNTQDEAFDFTPQVQGRVLEPGQSIILPGIAIDIELGLQTRYTFFTTIVGETLDGTNTCNGSDLLECVVGFNLGPVFPTMVPTPSPTITPVPTRLPNSTSCEVESVISCAVITPEGTLDCDNLQAPAATCPANVELLTAFLVYDGSLGPSVFLEIACGSSEYIATTFSTGEIAQFSTRASSAACTEATAKVYSSDPFTGGTQIGTSPIPIACPGPWTLGATIAPGFKLGTYVSTTDNGISFDYNANEVQVELSFIGQNPGAIPLTITSGEIVSPLGSESIANLPTNVDVRSQKVLQTQQGVVPLIGRSGQTLIFSQALQGVSNNGFANGCGAASEIVINL